MSIEIKCSDSLIMEEDFQNDTTFGVAFERRRIINMALENEEINNEIKDIALSKKVKPVNKITNSDIDELDKYYEMPRGLDEKIMYKEARSKISVYVEHNPECLSSDPSKICPMIAYKQSRINGNGERIVEDEIETYAFLPGIS